MTSAISKADMKFTVTAILAVAGIGIAYKLIKTAIVAYKAVDGAVDSVVDPLADRFFSSGLYQGAGVEHSDFKITNLYRDYFTADWVMQPEPLALMRKIYPEETAAILDMNNQLLPQYHSQINHG
jgi:hypothetical protein